MIEELAKKCKASVYLTVNEHRNYYQTAEAFLKEREGYACPPEIDDDVRQRMIDTDTVINLQFYPSTPIGSYDIYHFDVEEAIKIALDILKGESNGKD
jgi:hypothetical protein